MHQAQTVLRFHAYVSLWGLGGCSVATDNDLMLFQNYCSQDSQQHSKRKFIEINFKGFACWKHCWKPTAETSRYIQPAFQGGVGDGGVGG